MDVLIVDDDRSIRHVLQFAFEERHFQTQAVASVSELRHVLAKTPPKTIIMDVGLPDGNGLELVPELCAHYPHIPIIVISADTGFPTALKAMEYEVFDYFPKPFDLEALCHTTVQALKTFRKRGVKKESKKQVFKEQKPVMLLGKSRAMQDVYRQLARLAFRDLNVLISGESGTGKEVAARILHQHSSGGTGPFVAVNMAALPRELIETVLFGHEKGAFTGAVRRSVGKLEEARGGILFLDEIGDMPLEAQTRLLRVLQEGEYTVVGGKTKYIQCRILAATNRDLLKRVQEGRFREDLYYRINIVNIHIPPLRDRKEDITIFFQHFITSEAKKNGEMKSISDHALDVLSQWHWPGNIRELKNCAQRIVALEAANHINAPLVRKYLHMGENETKEHSNVSKKNDLPDVDQIIFEKINTYKKQDRPFYKPIMEHIEKILIEEALREYNSNLLKTAQFLGLNRNTLRSKIKKLAINVAVFKKAKR